MYIRLFLVMLAKGEWYRHRAKWKFEWECDKLTQKKSHSIKITAGGSGHEEEITYITQGRMWGSG